jgi:hypothetical protein
VEVMAEYILSIRLLYHQIISFSSLVAKLCTVKYLSPDDNAMANLSSEESLFVG